MKRTDTNWNPTLYNDKHSFVYNYGEDLITILQPEKHERILDLGCGSGQLTYKISQLTKEVVGIDSSMEMIADAKSKFNTIDFQVANAADFSFKEKFDAIFSNATLHWVLKYKEVIQCMFDNLNNGGRIVLEFGGKGNVQTIVNQLRKSLVNRGYVEQSELKQWYFPSAAEYTAELEDAGFKVTMAQHFDRSTELVDQNTGIKDWIAMFGKAFFKNVSLEHIEDIKQEVQEKIQSKCFKNGKWYADYKRIRIVAVKKRF
jgi:trans-aconitate methyltransferase